MLLWCLFISKFIHFNFRHDFKLELRIKVKLPYNVSFTIRIKLQTYSKLNPLQNITSSQRNCNIVCFAPRSQCLTKEK